MWISDSAIRRPVITVVVMVALVVFGLIALFTLKTDEFPDVAPPYVTVGVPYPGASPETVEKEVLDPIEEAISSITGVKKVNGKAMDGFATIMIEFLFTKPLPEATQDIRDAISRSGRSAARDGGADHQEAQRHRPADRLPGAVVDRRSSPARAHPPRRSGASPASSARFPASPRCASSAATSSGSSPWSSSPRRCRPPASAWPRSSRRCSRRTWPRRWAGSRARSRSASIRLKGRLDGPAEFAQLVVAERNGRLIRLGDVANVQDGAEEPRTLALFNEPTPSASTSRSRRATAPPTSARRSWRGGQRSRRGCRRYQARRGPQLGRAGLPSVTDVQKTLFEGALLTVLVVFLFLNSWRSTVITGLALPVSVLASFIAVWVFGFTLNTMSLLGLSLAIGILIDDAIVVRENIVRHVEMGKDHVTAAHEGTDEIGLAVTATTLSILAVFVPIAFLPGISGQWFKPFGLTMACAVLVSLLVSFSLDPMLSAYWPDPHRTEAKKAWITRRLDGFNALVRTDGGTLQAGHRLGAGPSSGDGRSLGRDIRSGTRDAASRTGGRQFRPDRRQVRIHHQLETPPGSNLEYTRRKAEEVGRLIRAHRSPLHLRDARRHPDRRGG